MYSMGQYLLRSMLYVPAYNKKLVEKSLTANADALIYDLEDSVPQSQKVVAREILENLICSGALKNKLVFVRVNSLDSERLSEDLKHILYTDITGLVLPKINTPGDLEYFDQLITVLEKQSGIEPGYFKFVPLIETAQAIVEIYAITKATERTIAMCFGGEDFLNDIQGTHGNPPRAFDYPRAVIATAARAAGILPIDTPYLGIKDLDGFVKEKRQSYEIGFAGVQVVSPRQLEVANECFTPNEEEVKRSQEIMEAWQTAMEEGVAIAMYQDKMIGPPMRKRAEKILEVMERIREKEY